VFVGIHKDLEPSRVGAPNLHVVSSTRTLDIPRLVIQLSLDCLWSLIKVPELSVSSISGLDHHVSVVDQIKIFVWLELRNNVEGSFNIETEVFAQFTFNWLFLPLIFIDDIEQLLSFSMLSMDNDILVLSVKTSRNFHNFAFLIDDECTISAEHLPPSRVDTRCKSNIAGSSIALDFHSIVLPLVGSDSLALFIEEELLCLSSFDVSSDNGVVGTDTFNNSLHW
jgi:hypothetical protein